MSDVTKPTKVVEVKTRCDAYLTEYWFVTVPAELEDDELDDYVRKTQGNDNWKFEEEESDGENNREIVEILGVVEEESTSESAKPNAELRHALRRILDRYWEDEVEDYRQLGEELDEHILNDFITVENYLSEENRTLEDVLADSPS